MIQKTVDILLEMQMASFVSFEQRQVLNASVRSGDDGYQLSTKTYVACGVSGVGLIRAHPRYTI